MTIALYGIGVSRGVVIGKAQIVSRDQLDIREYTIKNPLLEVKRFEEAIGIARQQLRSIRQHIPASTSDNITAFIDTHLLMMEDVAITHEPTRIIQDSLCNAEWALKLQRDALANVFEEMDDPYLRTRMDDIDYVINRIQRILLNQNPLPHEKTNPSLSGYIVFASNLTPADTVLMQHHDIAAFVTEYGGPTSHTAILAHSLGIPAIVGLQRALRYVQDGENIILDGFHGTILLDANKAILSHYQNLQKQEKRHSSALSRLKKKPAVTQDGTAIELQANVELHKDFDSVLQVGTDGIGLYRTEFLYMNRETAPDEEEHYETYVNAIKILYGLPITIRTLDLDAGKQPWHNRADAIGTNPALGLRAIRFCLKELTLFHTQLRAIIRASNHGSVRIMLPMISNLQEVRQTLQIIENIKREFDSLGMPYDKNLQVGGVIEVPAAAICANIFARELDFLSIGTNDLIQYTMAIDRANDAVNYLHDPLNPAVIKLIYNILQAGKKTNTPIAMCGEMAGRTCYTRLLLGLGLRKFSVHPTSLLEVKKIINESNLVKLTEIAKKALVASSGDEIASIMQASE